MNNRICRFCSHPLTSRFVDLGMSPLSNSYLKAEDLHRVESFYPLRVFVCETCFLVQIETSESPEHIFNEYAYFSSYSDTWLQHAREYTENMVSRLGLNSNTAVIEIASNDGYLLQYFQAKGIPVLGIEPAANVAETAIKKGIPTLVRFFGRNLAEELINQGRQADLIVGNNVLAHVPGLNDFVAGMKLLLKPRGVITMEFPHLMCLMAQNQFDTIYHEHIFYFSFLTAETLFAKHGFILFDVETLKTHGGSLRIYARHIEDNSIKATSRINDLREKETQFGLDSLETYMDFEERVKEIKLNLLEFVIHAKREGKNIVGYGAPAKGNTLLNYCGIGTDFIDYTVDLNPHKQRLYLPGTHIPIYHPEKIKETMPDYLLILPWNIKGEIMTQMDFIRKWGGKFVVPIPKPKVIP
ncbi:MAG: class I SAM-dependent methyltransferase [Pseudomonadota bacterium]